jgi:hypothetical protein
MSELKWELLEEVYGRLDAEVLKSFLEAEGIPVELFQESAGVYAYPVNVGEMGRVQIFVPKRDLEQARMLLDEFRQGDFEMQIAEEETSEDAPEEDEEEKDK